MTMTCDKHAEQQLLSVECAWCKLHEIEKANVSLKQYETVRRERDQAKYGEQDMENQRDSALLRLSSALEERDAAGKLAHGMEADVTDLTVKVNDLSSRLDHALKALKIVADGIPGPRLFATEQLQALAVEIPCSFDGQIERDAKAGKLDGLRDEAIAALKSGNVEDL